MWFSRVWVEAMSSACALGNEEARSSIGRGVRMPATTSSPCALTRYSPNSFFSPVAGERVKQTPVALRSLRLPESRKGGVLVVVEKRGREMRKKRKRKIRG